MKALSRKLLAFVSASLLISATPGTAVAQSSLLGSSIRDEQQSKIQASETPSADNDFSPSDHRDTTSPQVVDGPFAQWGIPTPPGAEGYEVNQATNDELNPQGLKEWHPTTNPNSEVIPGQMRSDREEIPAGIDKNEADKAEIREAQLANPDTPTLNARPGCKVYWPSPFEVCGLIKEKYDKVGGPTSFLLLPKSNELTNPDGIGKRSEFVNGYIYWHPKTGAHTVSLPAAKVWERHGWEKGFLGYPTTSDMALGNQWFKQDFQGGHVYTHNALPATQASIQGRIYDKWQSMGAQNSELGYPISDELTTPDGVGRYNVFEHGMIYWTPQHGAHPVMDPVLLDWSAAGYEKSSYGFPMGDPKEEEDFVSQNFEGGTLKSIKREGLPGGSLIGVTPYLEFSSPALAAEFFDRVEAGLEELPLKDAISLQAAGKRYGPCELSLDNPHPRKSSNFGAVGFKPHTKCTEKVLSVTHVNTLRYKYYAWWKKAPDLRGGTDNKPRYSFDKKSNLPHKYSSLEVEQDCIGDVETSFIGVTEGTIVTSTGTYYARAYSNPDRVKCKIPGNL
ncbi:LGFP repeat-containing protein [Corynebacterium confusum]